MYNSLTGTVTYAEGNTLWLAVGGIEFDLTVPLTVTAQTEISSQAKIFTYLHHKEDGMRLFGFQSLAQRELFLQLLKVDGIGPKQAVSVLSAAQPSHLTAMINNEDVAALATVPGVGPKKAAKMILALRGKLTAESKTPATATASGQYVDLIRALAGMGFAAKQAETVVLQLANELDTKASDFEQKLFREAIVRLSSF